MSQQQNPQEPEQELEGGLPVSEQEKDPIERDDEVRAQHQEQREEADPEQHEEQAEEDEQEEKKEQLVDQGS